MLRGVDAISYFSVDVPTVETFSALQLSEAQIDVGVQLREPRHSSLICFKQQPQPLTDDLARGRIQA